MVLGDVPPSEKLKIGRKRYEEDCMRIESNNALLSEGFKWAVQKAKTFVVSYTENGDINKGEGNKWYGPDGVVIDAPNADWAKPKKYGAAFWAGYYDRTAYYIRDFVHQSAGAAILGMNEELFQMYYTFVSNASEKTGWYAPWAFNFDHSIYYMDTPNNQRFVREITSQFELVETGYALYLWTGDKRYLEDEKIALFADKIMSDFISSQDGIIFEEKNGIPEGRGDIFQSSATYNERSFHAVEAGDSIAAMYRAMLCYSEILRLRGDEKNADLQKLRAEKLREYFNRDWSVVDSSDMYCYAIDRKHKKHYKWSKDSGRLSGAETLEFIAHKNLSYRGPRNNRLLDYIFQNQTDPKTWSDNIESFTYLPDLYFANDQPDRAWYFMKYILSQKDLPHEHKSQGLNGDYPEISFTFLSQVITGIMGIRPQENGSFAIKPQLPDEIKEISLYDFCFQGTLYDIHINGDEVVCTKHK